MKTVLQLSLLCGTFLVCGVDTSRGSQDRVAAGAIIVETASGRRFCGQPDPTTDNICLQLRSVHGGSSVLRPIRWDRIVQVELAGYDYTGKEFLAAFQAIRSALPPRPVPVPPRTIRLIASHEQMPPAAPTNVRPSIVSTPVSRTAPAARIGWLVVDGRVANWDSDAEVDGLLVQIQPRNGQGVPMPADGTLWVDFYGHRHTLVNRAEPPIHLGRWSQQVVAEEFSLHGAAYRFAFQDGNPVLDAGMAPDGLVRVQLSIPGQGVFEASDCLLRLRP